MTLSQQGCPQSSDEPCSAHPPGPQHITAGSMATVLHTGRLAAPHKQPERDRTEPCQGPAAVPAPAAPGVTPPAARLLPRLHALRLVQAPWPHELLALNMSLSPAAGRGPGPPTRQ